MQILLLRQGVGETETLNKVITFYQSFAPYPSMAAFFSGYCHAGQRSRLYSRRRCRKGNALAMVPPRCANHALWHRCCRQLSKVVKPTSHLKRARREMIFMF